MSVKIDHDSMRQYRKENFKVVVMESDSKNPSTPDIFEIRISTNGYQWECLGLTPEEWKKVKGAVSLFLHERSTP